MQSDDDKTWKIAQIAFLARHAITTLDHLPKGVREIDNDQLEESVAIDRAALREFADNLVDLTAQIEAIVSTLPERDFTIDRLQLHAAADRALRRGIVVPEQALFACRLLPYPDAFRALADALMHTDARLTWEDLTIADLLANPTGATIELGRIVAALAGLSPAAEVAACSDVEVRSLALAMAIRADDPEQ